MYIGESGMHFSFHKTGDYTEKVFSAASHYRQSMAFQFCHIEKDFCTGNGGQGIHVFADIPVRAVEPFRGHVQTDFYAVTKGDIFHAGGFINTFQNSGGIEAAGTFGEGNILRAGFQQPDQSLHRGGMGCGGGMGRSLGNQIGLDDHRGTGRNHFFQSAKILKNTNQCLFQIGEGIGRACVYRNVHIYFFLSKWILFSSIFQIRTMLERWKKIIITMVNKEKVKAKISAGTLKQIL